MKKMLVLALAAAMFSGAISTNAHAAPGGPGEKAREMRAREEAKKAREGAARVGKVSPEIATVRTSLAKSNLDAGLTSSQADSLGRVLEADPSLRSAAKSIIAMNEAKPVLAELGRARIEGLLNVSKIKSSNRNTETEFNSVTQKVEMLEQSYAALVLKAGEKAATWVDGQGKQLQTGKVMQGLLTKANEQIRRGKSVSEAMEIANKENAKETGVEVKLEDIKKQC